MNIKKIQELVSLMTENNLTELEVEQEGVKVRLIKKPYGVIEPQIIPSQGMVHPQPSQGQETKVEETTGKRAGLLEIKSPMVGTFYRAPSPEAEAYVKVGDTIHKGDVVCIVEAMKLMNEVKSEIDGKIVEIVPENAEAVEFGQTLFHVDPL